MKDCKLRKLEDLPKPFVNPTDTIVGSIIVGNSEPHGPSGASHTLDTVGGMMVAAGLSRHAEQDALQLYLDTDVAWYNYSAAKVFFFPVAGLENIVTVGGPGVNMITWKYFANP